MKSKSLHPAAAKRLRWQFYDAKHWTPHNRTRPGYGTGGYVLGTAESAAGGVMDGCKPCEITAGLANQGDLIAVGSGWTLNANVNADTRPSLVLQSRRHRANLAELDAVERLELGRLLAALSADLQALTAAARVYVMLFGESAVPHVHFHLVPRFDFDSVQQDPRDLATAPVAAIHGVADKDSVVREIASRHTVRDRQEPSRLVRASIAALEVVERVAMYSWLFKWRPLSRISRTGRAEFYVLFWLVLLTASWVIAGLHPATTVVAVALAVYRFIDLVASHLVTLLKRSRQRLASFQRSFLLAILNGVELALAVAVAARSVGKPHLAALLHGFDVVTLRGASSQPGLWLDAVGVLGTAAALLIVTGVFSLVVGLISQSYKELDDAS